MEKGEKFQRPRSNPAFSGMLRGREKIGEPEYINKNCWLVKTLDYTPYKRCQYCELKFRNCLFLHYQIVSLILILFFLSLSFLIEGNISKLVIISVFTLVIVYGYFFNKSTEKIIKANFAQRKAKGALEELTEKLQEKVEEQTKEIKEAYKKVEKAYNVEKNAKEELESLDKAKNQFLLATQHHLRTPLTSIMGYADLLLSGAYGKQNKKTIEVIKRFQASTNNLIKMVNEFLDITQFQLGKEVVSLKPNIQIMPILKEIVNELKFGAESRKIYLKLEEPNSEQKNIPEIKADPEKLKAALFNIVDNAVKYTNKGGVIINIKYQESNIKNINRKLLIIIKDTGIGMKQEELQKLFNHTFERGEQAKKTFVTGRGIGLYIASQIIRVHNGKIWAESDGENKGSTFYVELPIET